MIIAFDESAAQRHRIVVHTGQVADIDVIVARRDDTGRPVIRVKPRTGTVKYLDDLVRRRVFENRSQAIQQSVDEKIERLGRNRLAEECAKLDSAFEAELADEGLAEDEPAWPEY